METDLTAASGGNAAENAPIDPTIAATWKAALWDEFQQPYFRALRARLRAERLQYPVYPPGREIFRAFDLTPLPDVRVLLLGQDPYHGVGQAEGLCFSVRPGVPWPPSLRNIFQELRADLGCAPPDNGSLLHWARQGVLLLNSFLTVRGGQAASHRDFGWEIFTDRVIREVSALSTPVVFLLWGAFAWKKAALVDDKRHLVLKTAHPSPLSAYRGFFGSRHFSQANHFLRAHGREPVDWCLAGQALDAGVARAGGASQ